jgi:hypothetical protein
MGSVEGKTSHCTAEAAVNTDKATVTTAVESRAGVLKARAVIRFSHCWNGKTRRLKKVVRLRKSFTVYIQELAYHVLINYSQRRI